MIAEVTVIDSPGVYSVPQGTPVMPTDDVTMAEATPTVRKAAMTDHENWNCTDERTVTQLLHYTTITTTPPHVPQLHATTTTKAAAITITTTITNTTTTAAISMMRSLMRSPMRRHMMSEGVFILSIWCSNQ